MKQFLPALCLLIAFAHCVEEMDCERPQLPDYQRDNFQPPMYQFMKPMPPVLGVPFPENTGFQQPNYNTGFQQPNFNTGLQQPNYNTGSQQPNKCPNLNHHRTSEYVLSFDWAPRTKPTFNMQSSKGLVKMGSQIIAKLQVERNGDKGVRRQEIILNLENGDNTLIFQGTGYSDANGISISNVVLRSKDCCRNILINGDFSQPFLGSYKSKHFKGGFKGWTADLAELGDCRFYSNNWRVGQCIELDSARNQIYSQKFRVGSC